MADYVVVSDSTCAAAVQDTAAAYAAFYDLVCRHIRERRWSATAVVVATTALYVRLAQYLNAVAWRCANAVLLHFFPVGAHVSPDTVDYVLAHQCVAHPTPALPSGGVLPQNQELTMLRGQLFARCTPHALES